MDEDYKEFLKTFTQQPTAPIEPISDILEDSTPKVEKKIIEPTRFVTESYHNNRDKYEEIFTMNLPMGEFYPTGTRMLVRACTTEEIQDFSTYNKSNPFDFIFKINDILEKNVIFELPDGTISSYLNIFNDDRIYLIYNIREKTFISGSKLYVTVPIKDINGDIQETSIECCRQNLDVYRDEQIMEYYDTIEKVFLFETKISDKKFKILPPTIGLKQCFHQYLKIKMKDDVGIDTPFLKYAPYLKPHLSYMSFEDIERYEKWFKNEITPEEFLFLQDLIDNHLKIGLRGLKKNMGGATIRTHRTLPRDVRSILIIPNAFGLYHRQQDENN